jgi:hypothetical protein
MTAVWLTTACAGYLDVIPDDVATMEHAFSTRNAAHKFLMTCYQYLPNVTDRWANPGLTGGDELWWCIGESSYNTQNATYLAKGYQNANDPYLNYWDGARSGKNLFQAIRDCNIFVENIHAPNDLEELEREQWRAEAKVLKAYYHYYLLQLYGPVPVIRENLPINATSEEVRVYREPVDDVVNYIVELIDEALPHLWLNSFETRANDAGRITKAIAAAIKAKALVWGASPLLNGTETDPPQFSLIDNRGVELFPQTYSAAKWTRAAEATREAIEISQNEGGHYFYVYVPTILGLSPETLLKCKLRGAITEKFNTEIVWPSVRSTGSLELMSIANLGTYTSNVSPSDHGPTLKVAEEFYTKNGLPINEDPEWISWVGDNFIQRYDPIQVSSAAGSGIDGVSSLSEDHKYYVGSKDPTTVPTSGQVATTAKLHFYREPRFYAWLGFDRGIWEMNGTTAGNEVMAARGGEPQGTLSGGRHTTCGYFSKKLTHLLTTKNSGNTGFNYGEPAGYTYPLIRLTDLYLLYAEALNESKQTPDADVYRWIDSVRLRAGLKGVQESWANATPIARNKPNNKEGMRNIIKRERMIELSMESQRFFDLIRWKDAMDYLNQPVRGWNFEGQGAPNPANSYYTVTTYWDQRVFNTRDYFWPIKLSSLQINSNLVQNPGW